MNLYFGRVNWKTEHYLKAFKNGTAWATKGGDDTEHSELDHPFHKPPPSPVPPVRTNQLELLPLPPSLRNPINQLPRAWICPAVPDC
jgi:hypothetical protein